MKDAAYNLLQHHPVGLASFGLVCMGGAAWATARFGLRRVVVPARVLLIAWLAAVLVVTLSRLPVAHGLHHT